MSRYRKPLLWAGCALLLAFGALMGYASHGEEQVRNQYLEQVQKLTKAPVEMDYGFIPVDLLEGRTEYRSLDERTRVLRFIPGPQVEGRILMARVACGVGALGLVLLAVRAFVKEK